MGNNWNQRRNKKKNKDDNDQGFIELGPTWGFLKLFLSKEERKEGKRLQRAENEHQQPKGHSVNQQP